jgi:CheY-like chemotaxis protein
MRPFQVPVGITVSPSRVLVALFLLAAAIAAVAWLTTRRARAADGDPADEPLQPLRGFHIFGPDEDEDDRRVHVPLIGQRATLAAPPPPSAPTASTSAAQQPGPRAATPAAPLGSAAPPPATPAAAPVVARTLLRAAPPAPPATPRPNGHNGHNGTTTLRPRAPRGGNGTRPSIDDQLVRDILLVEDDETIATMYLMLLGSKGYGTRHAHDGGEGISMVRKERPGLILLDMMMPRMDGLQFLEALRGWPKTSDIPVVVLSNVADHSLVERALALGAVEYLIKAQTRPQVLIGAIPHWLRGNRALTV